MCADRNYSASQRVANKKARHYGQAFSKLLVAWGGIEPPTQGFSVLQNYYLAALNHVVEYIQINSLHKQYFNKKIHKQINKWIVF